MFGVTSACCAKMIPDIVELYFCTIEINPVSVLFLYIKNKKCSQSTKVRRLYRSYL